MLEFVDMQHLANYLESYKEARMYASEETKIPENHFSNEVSFPLSDVLKIRFFT